MIQLPKPAAPRVPNSPFLEIWFKRTICSDCKFDSGRFKWATKEIEGPKHKMMEIEERVNKTNCAECTRQDSLRRAQEQLAAKVREMLDGEKELRRKQEEKLRAECEEKKTLGPPGDEYSIEELERREGRITKRLKPVQPPKDGMTINEVVMSPAEAAKLVGIKEQPRVLLADVEDLVWDEQRCCLRKKNAPQDVYDEIPISRVDPSTLRLNFQPIPEKMEDK